MLNKLLSIIIVIITCSSTPSFAEYFAGVTAYEKEDYNTAYLHFLSAQDDPRAQYYLGQLFYDGNLGTKDWFTGVKWYRKAASNGNAEAMTSLGDCYAKGMGVKQDQTEAMKWYLRGAKKGDTRGMFNVAIYYENGIGVNKNYNEAFKWYLKSANKAIRETLELNLI